MLPKVLYVMFVYASPCLCAVSCKLQGRRSRPSSGALRDQAQVARASARRALVPGPWGHITTLLSIKKILASHGGDTWSMKA